MRLVYKILIAFAALALLLVVLAFGCVFLIESIGPGIAAQRINAMTGFRLDIESLRISIIDNSVEIKGLRLRNPEGWPEEDFVTINKLKGDVNAFSFVFGKRKVIDEVVVDVGPLCIVKNKDKVTNAKEFSDKLTGGAEEEKTEDTEVSDKDKTAEAEKESEPLNFIIHSLVIKTGKVRVADYTGSKVRTAERNLNLDINIKDATSVSEISAKITAQALPQILMMLSTVKLQLGGEKVGDGLNILADPLIKAPVNSLLDSLRVKEKKK